MQIQRLIEFIQFHHDKYVSLDTLAEYAGYSPSHFLRLCQQQLGIGPGKLNELVRLERGFYLLKYRPWLAVIDVALECGYHSSDGFSRAFKRCTGYSPVYFKQHQLMLESPLTPYLRRWQHGAAFMSQTNDFANQVTLTELPSIAVYALRHTGNPNKLTTSIQQFIAWRKVNQLPPGNYRTFNFLHNDPATVAPEAFCFDLACERPKKPVELTDSMRSELIPAGRYASLKVTGGDNIIEAAVNYLTSDFLAENNEEMGEFPVIVERITFYPDVPYHEAESHIFLLLSK